MLSLNINLKITLLFLIIWPHFVVLLMSDLSPKLNWPKLLTALCEHTLISLRRDLSPNKKLTNCSFDDDNLALHCFSA